MNYLTSLSIVSLLCFSCSCSDKSSSLRHKDNKNFEKKQPLKIEQPASSLLKEFQILEAEVYRKFATKSITRKDAYRLLMQKLDKHRKDYFDIFYRQALLSAGKVELNFSNYKQKKRIDCMPESISYGAGRQLFSMKATNLAVLTLGENGLDDGRNEAFYSGKPYEVYTYKITTKKAEVAVEQGDHLFIINFDQENYIWVPKTIESYIKK